MKTKKCNACKSCLMPFKKDVGVRESSEYCSYCFKNGKLCYSGTDLKEFQDICKKNMLERGTHPFFASLYTYMIRLAPRWKK